MEKHRKAPYFSFIGGKKTSNAGSQRDIKKKKKKRSESTDKPGSVVDSHSSRPAIARRLKRPTRSRYGPYLKGAYLVLLRVEFTVPRTVARRAVRSYRTLSPLPVPEGHRRYTLCCTGRRLTPPRCYLAPCPMKPGLSSPCRSRRRLSGRLRRRTLSQSSHRSSTASGYTGSFHSSAC